MPSGRPKGSNPLGMTYDAGNRLTTSILGASQLTTFTFDNNGNMTGEHCAYLCVLSTFVYDGENRCLNELRPSGANHTYTYAPDGLRRSMHQGGAANPVSFVWDGDDLLNEYVGGSVSVRYDVLDGEVLGEKRGAARYLYVPDPLGSVHYLLDTSRTIVGTYTYWPYGEVVTQTGATTPHNFVGNAGYYTAITNRSYVRARDYRPDLGRWQTKDPIGFAGGDWNLYAYADRSPVTSADPSGNLAAIIVVGGALIVAAAVASSCFLCLNRAEQAIHPPGGDKYLHCMMGCLGRTMCGRHCMNWGVGIGKEYIVDLCAGGTVEWADAVATGAGVRCADRLSSEYSGLEPVRYCASCCGRSGWGPNA